MSNAKPLLAFTVQDEENAEIVFAASKRDAVSDEIGSAGEPGVTVSRTEWADQYAPGPVPKLAMIDSGWWIECSGCECRISNDYTADVYDDNGDELEPRELDPVERGRDLFCTAACMEAHDTEIRERKAREREVLAYMRALAVHRLPGITLTGRDHVYVNKDEAGAWRCYEVHVGFTFPGCKIGDAHFRYDDEKIRRGDKGQAFHATVCSGDVDAYNTWYDAMKAAA